jgi:hypothetical protein
MAGSAIRGAARGATFGFADELAGVAGGVAGLFNGQGVSEGYSAARDAARRQNELDDRTNPASAIVGQLAGGVATLPVGLVGRAAQGAGALTQLLRSGAARGAASGATGGALGGVGDAEGSIEQRLTGGATGGLLGGAAGGVIGAGVSAAAPVAGRVLDGLGLRNPDVAAERQILRALNRDGQTDLPALAQRLDTPEPTALVDVGGRNTVNLGSVAANTPGNAAEVADQFVQARRAARPERMEDAVGSAFGGGQRVDLGDTVDTLQARRATQAAPRYEAAFSRINPTADDVARVLPGIEDPIGQQALARGLRVIEVENVAARLRDPTVEPFNPASLGVTRGENGEMVVENGYRNLRLLDAIKRGYDEIVEDFRDKTSGRLNLDQYGRAVNDARGAYVGNLRDMYQRYGAALDAWGGPSQSLEAIRQGRQSLRLDPDELRRTVSRTDAGNMDFLRLGAGRAVTDMTSDPARASSAARRLLEDQQMQRRIAALVPDSAPRDEFNRVLRRETDYTGVERAVSPRAGSQTARLQAGAEDMANDPPGGMLAALLLGRPIAAGQAALSDVYRRSQGINPSTADALAQRMFNTDTTHNQQLTQALIARLNSDTTDQAQRAAIMGTLLRATGGTAGQQVN